ncbi:MAG: NTP transferase domain-containing protein [Phycisphaerales bacterium]|nr:MAG: NTP transferase domain-containing protein [Phycisphaerales bacterium]
MQVVILCGGKGTRAYPYTEYLPKPMLPVAGQPILLHVMRIYAAQGIKDFILSLGHGKETIIDYFHGKKLDWNVELVDTGVETETGGRIEKCKHLLDDTFMATYADGLSDLRLDKLTEFHHSHDGLATVTCVPLVSQYGTVDLDETKRITGFHEKPVLREHWINAGFFVFDKKVFTHWTGANLEREVFPVLSQEGLLYAYQYDGFFKSMDTYKDQQELEQLYSEHGNG